jgi:hypothetical protein
MSWLFSQALVEEYLGGGCLDGEQSVQSNGKPIQQAYCAPGKMTDFCRVSQFGMMFKPLMENLGEELLMSFQEDFHAKTFQLQEKELELKESAQECGNRWQGLLARFDQDLSLWKTVQCSLLEDWEQFSETFPKWGSMRNGELFQQPISEQIIKEKEFGLWPTPVTMDSIGARSEESMIKEMTVRRPNRMRPGMLRDQVVWGTTFEEVKEKIYTTPTARMWKDNGKSPSELNRNSETLAVQAGGQLNPMWVEWLMGWPLGWTDLKPLEMDKSHFALQQHGNSSEKD